MKTSASYFLALKFRSIFLPVFLSVINHSRRDAPLFSSLPLFSSSSPPSLSPLSLSYIPLFFFYLPLSPTSLSSIPFFFFFFSIAVSLSFSSFPSLSLILLYPFLLILPPSYSSIPHFLFFSLLPSLFLLPSSLLYLSLCLRCAVSSNIWCGLVWKVKKLF